MFSQYSLLLVQVIAWSGAGVDVYPEPLANGTKVYTPGLPEEADLDITPEDPILFGRQIAADNTSMVTNYSSWVPQVCYRLFIFSTVSDLALQ